MEIVQKSLNELKVYKNNPRNNANSIQEVAESIKNFGFKVPILIDKNNEIVCGHTRYEASKMLKLTKVPCILIDDLNEEQIKAFRIVDNKVSEFSRWDYGKLKEELKNIDISIYNFDFNTELNIDDDDFISDTEITKEKKEKEYICPKCGEIFK